VSAVAPRSPCSVCSSGKVRRGDLDVEISAKSLPDVDGHTPVLVDDIISSGRTMLEAVHPLVARGAPAPVCVQCTACLPIIPTGFSHKPVLVVTSNSIAHASNAIDVSEPLANSVRELTAVAR